MAKGNSVKGGAKAAKVAKGSRGSSKGKLGKTKNVKRRGKVEKGAKGEPGKQSFGKGAGMPGGKGKKKGKGARHRQVSGVAPDPLDADDDSDVDESAIEGLEEYAGYSNFLLDMDVNQLKEPTKPAKPTASDAETGKAPLAPESRREKKKRKAEERGTTHPGAIDRGSDEELSEGEDDEADYESRPRKAHKWDQKKAEALPVRSADGKWTVPERPEPEPRGSADYSSGSADSSEEGELDDELDDEAAEHAAAEAEQRIRQARKFAADPRLAEMARYQARQQGIAAARETIAKTCAAIVENPEESGHRILALHQFYPDGDPSADSTTEPLENCGVVKKMLLLSQLAVFKDIVPGYKIRTLSDEEQQLKVTKEVRAQRDYENMLLSMYQKYLQRLHAVASALNKQRSTQAQVSLGVVAVKCLADLLQSLHHFNYSTNIVSTLIPMLDSPREEVVQVCSSVINQLFRRETYSAAVVTAVRMIDQYAQKRKYRMKAVMLDCLLNLRLTEDADEKLRKLKNQQKKEKKQNAKTKGTVATQTDAELERDMAESAAVMDTQSRRLAQAAMLRAMFLTYFRVLKSPRRLGSGVLTATLAGLGHFSHLISIDFLGDLFTCLNTLLRQGGVLPPSIEEDLPPPPAFDDDDDDEMEYEAEFKLTVTDALTACHAAMTLLSGERGETLEIDPRTTCTALCVCLLPAVLACLYFLLPKLCVAEFDHLVPTALDSLRLILLQRRQLSMPRVGAFLKALVSLAASTPMPHSSIAILAFCRQLLMRYPKVRRLLESTDEGQQTAGGVVGLGLGPRGFRDDVEPDHANALESTAWELSCLTKHWHPHVRDASQGLLAENGGAGRSSVVLASAPGAGGVNQLWNTYNVSKSFGFIPSFPPRPRGKIAPNWKRGHAPLPELAGAVDDPLSSEDTPPCFREVGWAGDAGSIGATEVQAIARVLRGYRSFIARTELTVSKA